jgi:hypothetical protein
MRLSVRGGFLRPALLVSALFLFAADAAAQVQPRTPPAGQRARAPGDTATAGDTARAAAREAAREAAAADTILQALLRREGYTPMQFSADSASFRASERVLRLFGSAEVAREGDRLTASDTIIYREATRLVEAYGRPQISGQAQQIQGSVMFYDLATRRATVREGRTQVAEGGANWFVRGDVTAEGSTRVYATRSIFTTDDREEPGYYFESDNIKVIRDRILVGRPARLYFRNVPVFWLPFVAQDLTRGRRSGLLTPEFSINDIVRTNSGGGTARGTGRQISNMGFYWAMSDYLDAQLSGAWRSGDYTGMRGALRYRWNSQFLDGSLSYAQFWREGGSRELQFFSNNSWRPDERTSVSLNANYASGQFLRDISTNYFQATQNITSSASMQRRFEWGTVTLDGNRTQSVANDRVEMTLPRWGIAPRAITLFQAPTPAQARWYSNSTLSFSASGSRSMTQFGLGARRDQRDETRDVVNVSQGFTMGNLGLSTGFNLNRLQQPEVAAFDQFPVLPRLDRDQGAWNASLSYRVGLIGETSFSPTLAFSQDLRRGTFGEGVQRVPYLPEPITTAGRYVGSPMRMSLGTSLNTALFGFLPGFGPFSIVRHKLTPGFSYSYVPEVQLTPEQQQIFGRQGGAAQNNLSLLSLNQTFEAKLREPSRRPATARPGAGRGPPAGPPAEDPEEDELDPEADDPEVDDPETPAAGPPGADTTAAQTPVQERKVTLLSINTSGFNYDFERRRRGESGFTTTQVTNTISSDYLRGLQLTMTHDLFDASGVAPENRLSELGRFSPTLTGLSTRFSLGEDSPFLRWLGMGRTGRVPQETGDSIPTQPQPSYPLDPTRRGAFTQNPQVAGRGPWRLDVGYTLFRPRLGGTAANDFQLGMSFSPTTNWGVNWYTNYSIEDGAFGGHQITLRRDLYRWEANFSFSRTPFGNTSFDVLVRLKDLPDLKFDYREANIGGVDR